MKKIIKLLIIPIILLITGCVKNESMENITIYTTNYPIEYVTKQLYGEHSNIKSIYPNGVNIKDYKLTDTLINQYSDNDLYIFNSLSNEKEYVKTMLKNNKNLKIIDVTSDLSYEYAVEELWLDPANLLSLANNVRKGFNEYIKDNPVLINDVEEKYNKLKYNLTELEADYRDEINNLDNKTIVVSNDMFLFFQNYGLNVISLDKNNENYEANLIEVRKLLNTGYLKYIFVPDNEKNDDFINSLNIEKMQLHTLSNLTDEQRSNYDYITLVYENLEILKKQLVSS